MASQAASSSKAVQSLFITLKRGLAGKKETHVKTAKALGLRHTFQTVEKPNNASIRGALDKIKHLVRVETDGMRTERLSAEEARKQVRLDSVRVRHDKK
jgi:large subunit ribosomal protein L30